MDLELKKGFQELQAQMIDTRAKIANLETCYKVCAVEAKSNEYVMKEFYKDGAHEYLLEPIGRMLVKRSGSEAKEFLESRAKTFEDQMKNYKDAKDLCLTKAKESENSLRELVNKKLNKTEANSIASESAPSTSADVEH